MSFEESDIPQVSGPDISQSSMQPGMSEEVTTEQEKSRQALRPGFYVKRGYELANMYGHVANEEARDIHRSSDGNMSLPDINRLAHEMLIFAEKEFTKAKEQSNSGNFEIFAHTQINLCLHALLKAPGIEVLSVAPVLIMRIVGAGHRIHKNSPHFQKKIGVNANREASFEAWSRTIDGVTGNTHMERVLAVSLHFSPWIWRQIEELDLPIDQHQRIAEMWNLSRHVNNLLWTYDPEMHGKHFIEHAGPYVAKHLREVFGQLEQWRLSNADDIHCTLQEISGFRTKRFLMWARGKNLKGHDEFQIQVSLIIDSKKWMMDLRDAVIIADAVSADISPLMLQKAGNCMLNILVRAYDPGLHGDDFRQYAKRYICAGFRFCIRQGHQVIPEKIRFANAASYLIRTFDGYTDYIDSSPITPAKATKIDTVTDRTVASRDAGFIEWAGGPGDLCGTNIIQLQSALHRKYFTWATQDLVGVILLENRWGADIQERLLRTTGLHMLNILVQTYDPGVHNTDFLKYAEPYVRRAIARCIDANVIEIPARVPCKEAPKFLERFMSQNQEPSIRMTKVAVPSVKAAVPLRTPTSVNKPKKDAGIIRYVRDHVPGFETDDRLSIERAKTALIEFHRKKARSTLHKILNKKSGGRNQDTRTVNASADAILQSAIDTFTSWDDATEPFPSFLYQQIQSQS